MPITSGNKTRIKQHDGHGIYCFFLCGLVFRSYTWREWRGKRHACGCKNSLTSQIFVLHWSLSSCSQKQHKTR